MNSKEESYLKNIISSCELILDDLEQGAVISSVDFCNMAYVDGIMFRMQQSVSKQLNPSHYQSLSDKQALWESTGGRTDA